MRQKVSFQTTIRKNSQGQISMTVPKMYEGQVPISSKAKNKIVPVNVVIEWYDWNEEVETHVTTSPPTNDEDAY